MSESDFVDFEDFCDWFQSLNEQDPLDKHEAATIYFNLETYNLY